MRKGEQQRGFVRIGGIGEGGGAAFVGQKQEAREVVFVGLDAAAEDFEPVEFRCVGAADGGRSCEAALGDLPGAAGGVVAFDDLHRRMGFEEVAALHQGDRVGVNLADLAERLSGQCGQHMRDAEFLFADDPCAALLQQFVVGEQTACDGVLDGRDAQQGGVCRHPGEQLVETQAGEDTDLPVVEVAACCRFVVASCDALYCDLFHSLV